MKILYVIETFEKTRGGPVRSALGLLKSTQSFDIKSQLLSFVPQSELNDITDFEDLRYGETYSLIGCYKAIKRNIERFQPDLVYIHGVWQLHCPVVAAVCRKSNIPYIIAPRGSFFTWSIRQKAWKKRIAMWLFQRRDTQKAAALHATSQVEVERLQELFPDASVFCAPSGVDIPEEFPTKTKRKDGRKTVLFLARLHPGKGLMELVEAWSELLGSSEKYSVFSVQCSEGDCDYAEVAIERLKEVAQGGGETSAELNLDTEHCTLNTAYDDNQRLEWHVEYAGPDCGGHLGRVQARIRELGLEEHFTYLGELDDEEKWVAYRRANLFVLPTHSENFGIVVAEALACGVPVITTKGAPWAELLGSSEKCSVFSVQCLEGDCDHREVAIKRLKESGRCGWWIEIGVEPLVEALREAMSLSDEEREIMGINGQALIRAKYTWDAIGKQMKTAFLEVLESQ